MTTFSDEVKKFWNDFVAEFKRRRKEMTMVDETVVPDEPSEADKPEGWRDPSEADPEEVDPHGAPTVDPEVTPGGTTPGEHSPGETPDRGDRAPGEEPNRDQGDRAPGELPDDDDNDDDDDDDPSKEKDAGETTGELSLEDVATEVAEGKWGVGQERRSALSEAGYNPKEVETEVTKILNSR